uniref:Uncharacterized protein n=1 Tax=uncultured organism MedDCM-OCT-S01-C7 TaxID=743602 RepID=D6PJ04_9ZZZZ|nr:hypothetical protein [uncultured organism MedDCM-OCT-S01-C7]
MLKTYFKLKIALFFVIFVAVVVIFFAVGGASMLVSEARKNIPQQVKVAFGGYNTRFNMKYDSPAEE